jgi:hypothetical protein
MHTNTLCWARRASNACVEVTHHYHRANSCHVCATKHPHVCTLLLLELYCYQHWTHGSGQIPLLPPQEGFIPHFHHHQIAKLSHSINAIGPTGAAETTLCDAHRGLHTETHLHQGTLTPAQQQMTRCSMPAVLPTAVQFVHARSPLKESFQGIQ